MVTPSRASIRTGLRGVLTRAAGALNLWGSLVALGLAPTAVAVLAAASGSGLWLWVALGVSVLANVALLWRFIQYRQRVARAWASLTTRIVDRPGWIGEPSVWLPDPTDLGSLQVSLADLEKAWSEAEAKVKADVAPDVSLGLEAFTLGSNPAIEVRGWSNAAKVALAAGCRLGSYCWISARRQDAPSSWMGPVGEAPLWRADDTWRELVRLSWLRERPFRGQVFLRPDYGRRTDAGVPTWSVDYHPVDEFYHPKRSYRLVDGQLVGPEA